MASFFRFNIPRKHLRSRPWWSVAAAALVTLLATQATLSQSAFETLEDAMTPQERALSGIDTLTPQQRAFLNQWLSNNLIDSPAASHYTASPKAKAPRAEETRDGDDAKTVAIEDEVNRRVAETLAREKVAADKVQSDAPFEANVVGDFKGWTGKTVFRLDNGQVWRQRSASTYRHKGSDMRVRFEQNWMGGWEMEVLSTGKSVLVKKVR